VREVELRCAAADHPGHGPRFLWTRSEGRRKRVGRQLAAAEVAKVRRELARHAEFAALSERIVGVNEQICEARPVSAADAPPVPGGVRGLFAALAEEKSAEIGRLAAEAARSLGCGDAGMEAAEKVIRAGMLRLGAGMPGQLLAADPGFRGSRLDCGNGHQAEFIACRDKTFDTVLGPVTVNRAWYHCADCGHGFAPRDAELGVAGTSLSPGLTAMNDTAAAAGPFAKAARLLDDLAGITLTAKRVERASSSYIATFEPASAFADLVKVEGIRRGAGHVRQLTIIGDGAAWIWNLAPPRSPGPPASWTSTTPASTCTPSPGPWSSC
jgi:Family of unknown function (DUF6788)